MPKYEIESWNPVINGNNTFPMPMIYFKPDKDFINYAEENKYQVLVEIEGTNSIYDGKKLLGVIDTTGYYPSYRPIFYNKDGLFVITLAAGWFEYPNKNGRMIIKGLDDKPTEPKPTELKKPIPPPPVEFFKNPPDKKCNNLVSSQIGWTLLAILIVFCVLLYISSRKNYTNIE